MTWGPGGDFSPWPGAAQMGEQGAQASEAMLTLPLVMPQQCSAFSELLGMVLARRGVGGPCHGSGACGRAWSRDICNWPGSPPQALY